MMVKNCFRFLSWKMLVIFAEKYVTDVSFYHIFCAKFCKGLRNIKLM